MTRKKTNRVLLVTLGSVAVVLALCLVIGIVGAIVSGGNKPETASTPMSDTGIPPKPNTENRVAYIKALEAVDPDIVHGKQDKAVDRGRNQCSSVSNWPNDQAKLLDLTNKRFTSPNHPDGFGEKKAVQILAAVRTYICPTY